MLITSRGWLRGVSTSRVDLAIGEAFLRVWVRCRDRSLVHSRAIYRWMKILSHRSWEQTGTQSMATCPAIACSDLVKYSRHLNVHLRILRSSVRVRAITQRQVICSIAHPEAKRRPSSPNFTIDSCANSKIVSPCQVFRSGHPSKQLRTRSQDGARQSLSQWIY